jgi:hypothetical protein
MGHRSVSNFEFLVLNFELLADRVKIAAIQNQKNRLSHPPGSEFRVIAE